MCSGLRRSALAWPNASIRSGATKNRGTILMEIIVDPQDEWLLGILPWRITPRGYIEATMYVGTWRKTVKFHHFIMGTPVWADEYIDHINRNKLDNRRSNLRWVNHFVSSQNRDFVD